MELSPHRGQEPPPRRGRGDRRRLQREPLLDACRARESAREARRGAARVAVLGEMAELGPDAAELHREVGRARRRARRRGRRGGARAALPRWRRGRRDWSPTSTRLRRPAALLQPGDVVLLKASRGAASSARGGRLVTQVSGAGVLAAVLSMHHRRARSSASCAHAASARTSARKGRSATRQAGHPDDGRRPHPAAARSPSWPSPSAARRLHRAGGDAGVRRDRLRRRLAKIAQQALAGARGPLEARAARAGRRAVLGYVAHHQRPLDATSTSRSSTPTSTSGSVWYVLVYLVVAGAANARQPDGRPRRPGRGHRDDRDPGLHGDARWLALRHAARRRSCLRSAPSRSARLDLAVFGAALVGACIGFLWYNSFPADVFMGDTGALGLGGALAALAVFTKTELLLLIIGGVFVGRGALGDHPGRLVQAPGRRVFLMAPIHHHFEMQAWSETKIIVRFWIIAALLRAGRFVLYYLRFDQYTRPARGARRVVAAGAARSGSRRSEALRRWRPRTARRAGRSRRAGGEPPAGVDGAPATTTCGSSRVRPAP